MASRRKFIAAYPIRQHHSENIDYLADCYYNKNCMGVHCDPKKDALNRRKHGISLYRAEEFDLDTARFDQDDRDDYGEVRWTAVGWLDGKLYVLIFVLEEDESMRVISLRKATREERREYAEG